MTEKIPNKSEAEIKEEVIKQYITLAKELSERLEGFPFPGIKPGFYDRLKKVDEEFPGYTTPIDTMIENYKAQGIRVVLGAHPESGNVFIMPLNGGTIEQDSLYPENFEITEDMDEDLKILILASIKYKNL